MLAIVQNQQLSQPLGIDQLIDPCLDFQSYSGSREYKLLNLFVKGQKILFVKFCLYFNEHEYLPILIVSEFISLKSYFIKSNFSMTTRFTILTTSSEIFLSRPLALPSTNQKS